MTRIMMATVLTSMPERDERNIRPLASVERSVPLRCTSNRNQPKFHLLWPLLGTAVHLSQCKLSPHDLEPLPFRTALCAFGYILMSLQHLLLLTLRATGILLHHVLSHTLSFAANVNVDQL